MTTQEQLDKMAIDVNAIIQKHMPDFFRSQARYRYYKSHNKSNKSRAKDQYFYTTQKINHKGQPRYVSGVYRYQATDKSLTPKLQAGHAKKKDAMARAEKLCKENK